MDHEFGDSLPFSFEVEGVGKLSVFESGKGQKLLRMGYDAMAKYEVTDQMCAASSNYKFAQAFTLPTCLYSFYDIKSVESSNLQAEEFVSHFRSLDAFDQTNFFPVAKFRLVDMYVLKKRKGNDNTFFRIFMLFDKKNDNGELEWATLADVNDASSRETEERKLTEDKPVDGFVYLTKAKKVQIFKRMLMKGNTDWKSNWSSVGNNGYPSCFCKGHYYAPDLTQDKTEICVKCNGVFHTRCQIETLGQETREENICVECMPPSNFCCDRLFQFEPKYQQRGKFEMWGCDFCSRTIHWCCVDGASKKAKEEKLAKIRECCKLCEATHPDEWTDDMRIDCMYMIGKPCLLQNE